MRLLRRAAISGSDAKRTELYGVWTSRRHGVLHRMSGSAVLLLAADTLNVALDAREILGVQHQRAIGHAFDIARLRESNIVSEFDRDLRRSHLLAILLRQMAAETSSRLLQKTHQGRPRVPGP